MKPKCIRIGAVGDISFKGRYEDKATSLVFRNIIAAFEKVDFMVANLESPLVSAESSAVPGKCTLRGAIAWAEILKKSGINLVSLSNNHMMDYGERGLFSTITALDDAGITYVGAGKDIQAACLPAFKDIAGKQIAFLGRSSVVVSSKCYAGEVQPGVAFLDIDELVGSIRKCRKNADYVIVMLHWGMEHYHYPSPSQRLIASKIAGAGADILLGHHPHVLQGEEVIDRTLVLYSSGNFFFDDFSWSATGEDGQENTYLSTLTGKNRQGMVSEICLSTDGRKSAKQTFTEITYDSVVRLDIFSGRINEFKKLCLRLHLPFYGIFWKLYSIKREWNLRLKNQLSPNFILHNFYKIRPRHFKELSVKVRRSAKVSSGKSTNPYEG